VPARPSPPAVAPRRTAGDVLVAALLGGTLAVAALWAATVGITAGDLWWHLAAGRWIVQHGRLPLVDPFSYTAAGAVWHNQEWLSQVLLYATLRLVGGTGLALAKIAVVAALFAAAAWIGWRRSGSVAAGVAVAVGAAVVCHPFLDLRPQLAGFAATLAVLAVLDAWRRGAAVPIRLVLPAIMALWVNLHSSFLYGLGVIVLAAATELVKARFRLPADPLPRARAMRLAQAAALAVGACLLSPRPLDGFLFPLEILGPGNQVWRTQIVEWMRPVLFRELDFNPAAFGWLLVAQAALVVAALLAARRRVDVTDLAVVAVTAVFALGARRFIPLFALVSAPFAARNLALVAARLRVSPVWRRPALALAAAATLVVIGQASVRQIRTTYADGLFDGMVNMGYFPTSAAEFLRENPLDGRLYSLYGWGGYLLWTVPGRKVFIDGRAHMVYPQALYREQWLGEGGDPRWSEMLDRHGVSLVLWPTETFAGGTHKVLARALHASPDWRVVYEDAQATVYAHVTRARAWVDAYARVALRYPDTPRAQLFLANAYLAANRFAEARDHLRGVTARFPDTTKATTLAEERLAAVARTRDDAAAWFGLGFYREVRGDTAEAADAYRRALARGLAGVQAAYASARAAADAGP
jgi:hypothetical protein